MIPVHGNWAMTERCLEAIDATEVREIARVVVVNDASPDDTLERLHRYPWVAVKDLPANVGFPGACNAGAADVHTEYLLLLNNDTEPLPGFLNSLVELADDDSSIAIIGSRLVYPDGRLQEAGGIVWADANAQNYGRDQSPDDPRYLYVRDVDYSSAASVLIRSDFWREVGGFDTRYSRGYYEDTDLAFAAHARSRRVVYQPESVVVHVEGGSHGTDPSSGIKRFQEVNRLLFLEKWRDVLPQQRIPGSVPTRVAAGRPSKRSILFLDHAIPRPDHDSGSRRSWEILQICRELGYLTVMAAENRDPFSPEARRLRRRGTLVMTDREEIRRFISTEGKWLACVVVARADVARDWQPWLSSRHRDLPVIFDTVDLHHIREMMGAKLFGSLTDRVRARWTKKVELDLISRSAATLVVSETERRYLAARRPAAAIFTVGNIHHSPEAVTPAALRRGLVFVGTFMHQPNEDGVRWFLNSVWPLVPAEIKRDGLVLIGEEPPQDLAQSPPQGVTFSGWVADIEPVLNAARVSIAPLRFGAGIKGKVGEAWAYGLPVVGTTVAFDGMAERGNAAYLAANGERDFARMIERVYRDELLWQAASDAGRKLVAERFGPSQAQMTIKEVLARFARAPQPAPD